MAGKPTLPHSTIIEQLKTGYGIEASSLSLLALGADMNATIYKASGAEGTFFVKLKRGHGYNITVAVIEHLREFGIDHIILPRQTLVGDPVLVVNNDTLIVYPFMTGSDGFSREFEPEQWREFGRTIAQVHALEIPQSLGSHLRRETFSSRWRQAVRNLYASPAAATNLDDAGLDAIDLLKKHKRVILQLVEESEALCTQVQGDSFGLSLCHADLHAGNILINGTSNFYVVDWDEAMQASKERDLMFIGAGVGNVWNQPAQVKAFFEGYGPVVMNEPLLAYYRLERIVEDIALYGHDLLHPEPNQGDRAEMFGFFAAQFDQNGVVDIALKLR